MKLGTVAHRRAIRADNEWSAALANIFGNRAGDVRYTKEGEGNPGTVLRNLYEMRTIAQQIWIEE
jgi:hypothetical protein